MIDAFAAPSFQDGNGSGATRSACAQLNVSAASTASASVFMSTSWSGPPPPPDAPESRDVAARGEPRPITRRNARKLVDLSQEEHDACRTTARAASPAPGTV